MLEQKIFTINMEMGAHTFANFDAVTLPTTDDSLIFCRFEEGNVTSDKGIIRIDYKKNTAGLLYDIFTILSVIKEKEEVDGNIHLVCSSDLFPTIDIYICEATQWVSLGKSIFHQ